MFWYFLNQNVDKNNKGGQRKRCTEGSKEGTTTALREKNYRRLGK